MTKNLEGIITFSCGIGRSFEEAEVALGKAKERKAQFDGNRKFSPNIVVYNGEPIADIEDIASNARDYARIVRLVHHSHTSEEDIMAVENLGRDPRTGLYNKMGYDLRRLQLRQLGFNQGYYILFDGNNMKDANSRYGSSFVDNLLAEVGKSLSLDSRSGIDRRDFRASQDHNEGDRRQVERRGLSNTPDIVAHRVNDGAGDEFLVFLPMPSVRKSVEEIYGIAMRFLMNMYNRQLRYLTESIPIK
ncbi:hypothetical protein HYX06_02575 [Candidatus Woesearchaeota archaeon]|nr:hypothetical protein [Candidatus Woesearchaeota archaeon]